ncbi:MAG: response regulator [Chitinophagales bacterium]
MKETELHILLIEDNPSDVELVKRYVKNHNRKKIVVHSLERLEEAIIQLDFKAFDILLMDVNLPDSNKKEALQFIKKYNKKLPIIVMSGLESETLTLESIKSGAEDFIEKKELNEGLLQRSIDYSIERHQLKHQLTRIAQELKDKKERLIEAQAIANIGNWTLDPITLKINWSIEALNVLQSAFQTEKTSLQSFLEIVDQKDRKNIKDLFRNAMEGTVVYNEDIVINVNTMSEARHINLRLKSNDAKQIDNKRIVGTIQDISDRKKIEEALKKSEEKYYNLFDQSRDAIYITSEAGDFLDFNKATTEIFGYSKEEMKHLNVRDLYINPEQRSAFIKEIKEKGFVKDYEVELKDKFNNRIQGTVTSSIWKTLDGKILGFQGTIRDFTQKRRAEELIKEKEFAQRSSKMKERFLANMSHEIRTPMNAISGLTRLLSNTSLSEIQKEYLGAIESSTEHLLALINDILDFSKIEAGEMKFDYSPFQPRQLFDRLNYTFKFKAKERDIELIFEIAEDIPQVLIGDPVKLNQILINLVGNAVKFTDKGFVKLIVRVVEKEKDKIFLQMLVKDTGIGIPDDKLENIFQTFEQINENTARLVEGTGLGLAISRQLIELQGGKIEVKSKVGQGSEFIATMPFRQSDASPGKESAIAPVNKVKAFKPIGIQYLLLVEDKKLNQMVASETIKSWWGESISIDIAENGVIACEKVKNKQYDAILMDIQMPEMNGYDATRAIREMDAPICDVPIIALTAYATKGEAEKCIEAGMNSYVSKPIDPNELYQRLAEVLNPEMLDAQDTEEESDTPEEQENSIPEIVEDQLNMNFINTLTGENSALKKKLLDLVLEETPEELVILKSSIENQNWERVRSVAHKMKSSFSYLGMKNILEVIKAIELEAKEEKDLELIPLQFSSIEKSILDNLDLLRNNI